MLSVDYVVITPGNPLTECWAGQRFETRDLLGKGETYELCTYGFLWRTGDGANRDQAAIDRDLMLTSGKETVVARMSSAALEWMRPLTEAGPATQEFLSLSNRGRIGQENALPDDFSLLVSDKWI